MDFTIEADVRAYIHLSSFVTRNKKAYCGEYALNRLRRDSFRIIRECTALFALLLTEICCSLIKLNEVFVTKKECSGEKELFVVANICCLDSLDFQLSHRKLC